MTREIRLALLEADVNYKVVKEFINNADKYDCKDFIVFENCTGGQIYYKYVK